MTFNLAPASKKKMLTPNPSPDRMLAVECEVAANIWFTRAIKMETRSERPDDIIYDIDMALKKAAKYEQMAHDGRA